MRSRAFTLEWGAVICDIIADVALTALQVVGDNADLGSDRTIIRELGQMQVTCIVIFTGRHSGELFRED